MACSLKSKINNDGDLNKSDNTNIIKGNKKKNVSSASNM